MHTGIQKNEKMNKIGPGIAKILRKTSRKHFCLSISAVMYRTYARQLSCAIKQRPQVLACISSIPGWILVIFSILKIPLYYSISFIKLKFLHIDCGKSYNDFNQEKLSQTQASTGNCSIKTNKIQKTLIHHVSLYVYFQQIKFLANPCTLKVRDLGFYAHKQLQTSLQMENSIFLQNSNKVC